MNKIECAIEDAELTKNLIIERQVMGFSKKPTFSGNYNVLYNFATEDIATYLLHLKNVNKSLTVGASGDQALNLVFAGAKIIDVFDINCLVKYILDLKIAAVKSLNRTEFIEYFTSFNYDLFLKIRLFLPDESRIYWEKLYSFLGTDKEHSRVIIKANLFPYRKLPINLKVTINSYLNSDANYEATRAMLSTTVINFLPLDFKKLGTSLDVGVYDTMIFSNIFEYFCDGYSDLAFIIKEFYDYVMTSLYPKLNNNGTMMLSYLYCWSKMARDVFATAYHQNPSMLLRYGVAYSKKLEEYYNLGLTEGNLRYYLLQEEFKNENLDEVPTRHVLFGHSADDSHDLALVLKKGN